jgi:hypothetical protein
MKELETNTKLIATFECKDCINLEKRIYRYLKEYKISSGWFSLSNDKLNIVINLIYKLIAEINNKLIINTCSICNFSTYKNENYQKHLESKQHKNKITNNGKYVCPYCNYVTNNKSNLNRHINSSIHLNVSDNITDDNSIMIQSLYNEKDLREKLIEYQKDIIKYQYQLKLKEFEIENQCLKQQNSDLKNFIKSGKHGNTYNISIKNYVQQNYPNAPPLTCLSDYEKIKYENDDFIDTLVYNYNSSYLHKYLGDFIVKYYKKDNPSEQSMWSSDTARLTYIIKELLANNKSIWNHDYKGIKTKNYIINPLLKYIKDYIDEFWMQNLDNFKNLNLDELIKLQNVYQTIYKIKKDIDNDILGNDIVRYIAPHFYMNKNDDNLIDIKIENHDK